MNNNNIARHNIQHNYGNTAKHGNIVYQQPYPFHMVTTVPIYGPYNNTNKPNQYNQYNQHNQMKPRGHKPAVPNKRKIKSAKIRGKDRQNNAKLPLNKLKIKRKRSKTEGDKSDNTINTINTSNTTEHTNCYPLYMSTTGTTGTTDTTQQIFTPPPPADHNRLEHQWQDRTGSVIVHRNQPTYDEQEFGNVIQNSITRTPVTPVTPVTPPIQVAAVLSHPDNININVTKCPLSYIGCNYNENHNIYNLNKHYTQYQQKHLHQIITHFDSKFKQFENNYSQKINHLENENTNLRNQLQELMQRINPIQ